MTIESPNELCFTDPDRGLHSVLSFLEWDSGRKTVVDNPSLKCVIQLLKSRYIQSLKCIYEKMSKSDRKCKHLKPLESNACNLMAQIYNSLKDEWISECQDLCQIIGSPHLRAVLFAADCVARSDYSPLFVQNEEIESENDGPVLKLVKVVKNDEPLGATVKIDEKSGAVVLARILVGGAAHRSGVIGVGDQILEVNGISVRGRSPVDVIHLLETNSRESVISFKLLTTNGSEHNLTTSNVVAVRAHFDYDPSTDPYIPCGEIGLAFKRGSVLNIVSKEDPNWWQACKLDSNDESIDKFFYSFAGLIPGQRLQERRFAAMRDLKSQSDRNRYLEIMPGIKSPFRKSCWTTRKVKKHMYDVCHNTRFDQDFIATYEPVAKYYPRPNHVRPVVFFGPVGVGRKTLTRLLLEHRQNRFRRPVPHTTRYKRFSETDGIDYHFVSEEWMESEIKCGNFVELCQLNGNYYGIHKEAIRQIINKGFVCLLNLSAQGLKRIHSPEFKPYVVFVRPSYDLKRLISSRTQKCDNSGSDKEVENYCHSMIFGAHKLHHLYGHYFDITLINDELRTTFVKLLEIIHSLETEPKWVPIGWAHT